MRTTSSKAMEAVLWRARSPSNPPSSVRPPSGTRWWIFEHQLTVVTTTSDHGSQLADANAPATVFLRFCEVRLRVRLTRPAVHSPFDHHNQAGKRIRHHGALSVARDHERTLAVLPEEAATEPAGLSSGRRATERSVTHLFHQHRGGIFRNLGFVTSGSDFTADSDAILEPIGHSGCSTTTSAASCGSPVDAQDGILHRTPQGRGRSP